MARFPGKPQPHQITEKMSISNQESRGGGGHYGDKGRTGIRDWAATLGGI